MAYDANLRFNTRPDYKGKITLNTGGIGVSGVFSFATSPTFVSPTEAHLNTFLTHTATSGENIRNFYN